MAQRARSSRRPAAPQIKIDRQIAATGREMQKPAVPTFVGETGPGAVINQYLPQPGHHTGRRIIKIEDTPAKYWLDASSSKGTAWSEYLGIEKSDDKVWEVREPERLAE